MPCTGEPEHERTKLVCDRDGECGREERHCVRSIENWIRKWEAGGNETLKERGQAPKAVKKVEQEKI